ncbi:hypothetical protein BDY24DRAFT_250561 [Mrakia frigida]|uniref:uncharacterized protein n=1 Tax=Mrakia frigida TaxID=29902 RepID=UPI003FCC202F
MLPSTLLVLLLSLSTSSSVSAAGGPSRLGGNSHLAHHRSIVKAQRNPNADKRSPIVLLPELVNDNSRHVYEQAQKRQEEESRMGELKVRRKRAVCIQKQSTSAVSTATASALPLLVASSSSSSSSSTKTTTIQTSITPTSTSIVIPTTSSTAMTSAAPTTTTTSTSSVQPTSTSTSSFLSGWTSPESSSVPNLESISLATALASSKGTDPGDIVSSTPDGSTAMEANYLAGVSASASGWSFYANHGQSALRSATEVVLTYKVWFAEDFDWVKGGKLPGLYGGIEGEYGCSGGEQADRDICWSARLMWRKNGMGELYTYLPLGDTNVNACEASGDGAICNNETYGLSFGRGEFTWPKGQWVTAEERVRLNDVGSNNGYIRLSVNGNLAISGENLNIRTRSDSGFEGIYMSTFFGGSDSTWAPATEQHAWFKDFQVGIVA